METKGPVLVFIHDWFTDAEQEWKAQISWLRNFYNIHIFTLEGHNNIYSAKLWKSSILETNRKRLRDFLRRQGDPVFIVAHGISSVIVLQAALEFPDRIRSMVLINPRIRFKGNCFYKMARFLPDIAIRTGLLFSDPHGEYGNPFLRVQNQLKNLPVRYARMYMKELSNVNLEDDLKNIQVKTCLILGDLDRSLHIDSILRMNDALPSSHLIRYSNLGHNPHKENPQVINHIIHDFFKKSDGILSRSLGSIKEFFKFLFKKDRKQNEDSGPSADKGDTSSDSTGK